MKFQLNVNSRLVEVDVDPDLPLLWALRGHLQLSDAAYGCAQGLCDACKVNVDGMPVRSCITPVCTIGSARITTGQAAGSTLKSKALKPNALRSAGTS
ncbi:MAG TPA: 2Fe-2S iron-sulfur cluster-binding protein [Usitatibacter sp.]|nr:2Fe-2S iron-sulfur cluster-binding protein [Usitatibacter sp.]